VTHAPTDPEAEVYLQLSSLQNVMYRHTVSTGMTRSEWLDMTDEERADVVTETVMRHVEVGLPDEPHPAEREHWPEEYRE
jgi:hypothetical protein